jgi:hypothetical protein
MAAEETEAMERPGLPPSSGVEGSIRTECYVSGMIVADNIAAIRELAAQYDRQSAPLSARTLREFADPAQETGPLLDVMRHHAKRVQRTLYYAGECGLGDKHLLERFRSLQRELERRVPDSAELLRRVSFVSRRLFQNEDSETMERERLPFGP